MVGGVVGLLVGAAVTFFVVRRKAPPAQTTATDDGQDERRRRAQPLMDRAGQVMIAYSAVIDAGNAADREALREAVDRMRAVGSGSDELLYHGTDDGHVAEAARAFFAFVRETQGRVDERLASRPDTVSGELRSRAEALATAVGRLNDALSRYVG